MSGWKFYLDNQKVAEPIGFDSVEFNLRRLESQGIDQPFTTEFTFIGKGAKILKSYFDSGFINDSIPFKMTSTVNVNGSKYEFNGFINMSVYTEKNTCDTNYNGWEITVGIIESDFKDTFLSRQTVDINLLSETDLDNNPIDPLVLKSVRLHSQELFLQAFAYQYDPLPVSFISNTLFAVFPVYWKTSDFGGIFGNTFDPKGTTLNSSVPVTNVHFVNNDDKTRTILASGTVKVDITNNNATNPYRAFIIFAIWDNNGNIVPGGAVTILTTPLIAALGTYNADLTFTDLPIVLLEGYRFTMAIEPEFGNTGGFTFNFLLGNELQLNEFSTESASNCDGLLIFDFLQRIIYQMTGNSDGLVSDFLNEFTGCAWNNLITTGLYIRNGQLINEVNPQLTTNWKKVFEDLSRVFCLGWGFEQDQYGDWKIRVEPYEYFYNSNVIAASFSKVSDIIQNALSDKIVNNIQVGYDDKWKNIAVSGVFETNTSRSYFVPNKARNSNSGATLDMRSGLIASGYAIEFSRRLQFLVDDSGSSDRPNDYNLFIIWLNANEVSFEAIQGTGYDFPTETGAKVFAPGTVSYGSNFIAFSDSPIDRMYNVIHTPARVAAQWWKVLGMHTYGLPTAKAKLFFQSGEYFTTYGSQIDSASLVDSDCTVIPEDVTFYENENIGPDVLKEGFKEYLFKPIGLEFTVPQTLCDFLVTGQNGTGLIRVKSGNKVFYGWIVDTATNKPITPSSGNSNFKLILSNKVVIEGGDYDLNDYDSNDFF